MELFNWIACLTSFISFFIESVFLFIRVNKFFLSHVAYLNLKNDFLTLKLTFLYFNSKRWGQMSVCRSNWRVFKGS